MLPTLALKLAMTDGLSLSQTHEVQANKRRLGGCNKLLLEIFSAARHSEGRMGKDIAMHLYMTCSAPERSTWHMIAADLAALPSFAPFAKRGMKACEEYKLP